MPSNASRGYGATKESVNGRDMVVRTSELLKRMMGLKRSLSDNDMQELKSGTLEHIMQKMESIRGHGSLMKSMSSRGGIRLPKRCLEQDNNGLAAFEEEEMQWHNARLCARKR